MGVLEKTVDQIAFGDFQLFVAQRRLLRRGQVLRLGDRALDLLIALVARPGEVLEGQDLIHRVWRNVHVDERVLRVHISALRRTLGADADGAPYIVNVRGRGYAFAAPVETIGAASRGASASKSAPSRVVGLPPAPRRMVGREAFVDIVFSRLSLDRLVTIVGPGGIGKTTVAVAMAHRHHVEQDGEIWFVDLTAITDAAQVVEAIASVVGVTLQSDPVASLTSYFRERPGLLVLDSCEHVIDAIAAVAERCAREAPRLLVLATSREPLGAEGEQVYRLPSLAYPDEFTSTAARALEFPAVQLLVERAAAQGGFELTDSEAPLAAEICRRLDGIALAIELAAGRLHALGLARTAALLDGERSLRWTGHRTAPPRHQTLQATMDWSYAILDEAEKFTFRRLSSFVGRFSIAAACTVARDERLTDEDITGCLANLVAKSLVATELENVDAPYRLLDTARAYGRNQLAQNGEQDLVARRHALFVEAMLAEAHRADGASPPALRRLSSQIGNVRMALAWAFSDSGDPEIALRLAVAAAPVLLELTLWTECETWTAAALALQGAVADSHQRLALLMAHGQSLLLFERHEPRVRAVFEEAADLAHALGEGLLENCALLGLHRYFGRNEDYGETLKVAERMRRVAARTPDKEAGILADLSMGISHHFLGRQGKACSEMSRALERMAVSPKTASTPFVGSATIPTLICFARAAWLHGLPDQAMAAAQRCTDLGEALRREGGPGDAAAWVIQVYFWAGQWAPAQSLADLLMARSGDDAESPARSMALALRGELLTRRGDPAAGVPLLRARLDRLRAAGRYSLMPTMAFVEGLMALSQWDEAASVMDDAIRLARAHNHLLYMPEMLRLRGQITAQTDRDAGLALFDGAIDLAGRQSALSWELRAVISRARLQREIGQTEAALASVQDVLGRFTEGFALPDLVEARELIAAFRTEG